VLVTRRPDHAGDVLGDGGEKLHGNRSRSWLAFATNAPGGARLRRIETRYDRSFAAVGFFLADFIGFGPKVGPNGRHTGPYWTPQDQTDASGFRPISIQNHTRGYQSKRSGPFFATRHNDNTGRIGNSNHI